MRRISHVSDRALELAFELGRKMARTERRLIPYLSGAHQYATYPQFLLMHRHRLEQYSAFEPWEVQIVEMAEREAQRLGVRSELPRSWEFAHNHIEMPLRSSFWFGWETVYRLQLLYKQQLELHRREHEPSSVLRVHNPPQSPLIPCSPLPDKVADDERWDTLAAEMFESLESEGERELADWQTPAAHEQNADSDRP